MSDQPAFAPPPPPPSFPTELLPDIARPDHVAATITSPTTSHKRKREDSPAPHPSPINDRQDVEGSTVNNNNNENTPHQTSEEGHSTQPDPNGASNPANATTTAAAALGIYPNMTGPIVGALPQVPTHVPPPSTSGLPAGPVTTPSKPVVGSEEWHRVRRDNHKEVERRRRETINEGINEIAKIVPNCEKNKGSILQRAIAFITQLKENEAQNIEKWTLEKLLTEQAITELSASNDKYKSECERAWREAEHWKKMCEEAGLISPKEDVNATTTEENGAAGE